MRPPFTYRTIMYICILSTAIFTHRTCYTAMSEEGIKSELHKILQQIDFFPNDLLPIIVDYATNYWEFTPRNFENYQRYSFLSDRYIAGYRLINNHPASYTITIVDYSNNTNKCIDLKGHTGRIEDIQALRDDNLASYSYDKTIRIWDITRGTSIHILKGHTHYIQGIQALRDGNLASYSYDKTIRIWDITTGTCSHILKGHTDYIQGIQVLPNGNLASYSADKTIRIWNITTGRCIQILKGHTSHVENIQVLPNNKLASCSLDKTIRIWDITTGSSHILKGHTTYINGIQVLPNGNLASYSQDETIRIWDIIRGTSIHILKGHTSYIQGIQALPNDKLASYSLDNTIRIWNSTTGTCSHILKGHTDYIQGIQVLPNNKLASCSLDKTIRIWNPTSGKHLHTFSNIESHALSYAHIFMVNNNKCMNLLHCATAPETPRIDAMPIVLLPIIPPDHSQISTATTIRSSLAPDATQINHHKRIPYSLPVPLIASAVSAVSAYLLWKHYTQITAEPGTLQRNVLF